MLIKDDGSYGAGFALGFFLGLIGVIIAIAIDKTQTRRGAVTGFLVSLGITIVITICFFAGVFNQFMQ